MSNPARVALGAWNKVHIRAHSVVYAGSTIGSHLETGHGVVVANDRYPICKECMRGPTIKRGARVGINATLLPEVVIGEGALVGVGAVVTRDVPAAAVVVGNPARVIGKARDLKHSASHKERAA